MRFVGRSRPTPGALRGLAGPPPRSTLIHAIHAIHANARTTPAVRAEIAGSTEPTGVLARRYGVSTETLRTGDGETRKRYLSVAIDRASRFVHLAVKDDETERSAVAFLTEAVRAFPFQVSPVLTDRGSCFTADGFERACRTLGVAHRTTGPSTPRTNGMVERFNGRIQREVLGITVASHRDLDTLLPGFNQAYNARRQRVLQGRSPETGVRERLSAAPARANRSHDPPFDPCSLPKALQVIARTKDGSHPDT